MGKESLIEQIKLDFSSLDEETTFKIPLRPSVNGVAWG